MPSGFLGLDTALRALLTSQQALNVVSHNIANVNTPGYSRQQAVLSAQAAYTVPEAFRSTDAGQIGTGVQMTGVRRMADDFLAAHVRQQQHILGEWEVMYDTLQDVEAILSEPSDVGLAGELDEFWGAWSDLASDPQNVALRSGVLEAGNQLSSMFNAYTEQITIARESLNDQIQQCVEDINSLSGQIADLNVQIAQVRGAGDTPGDLLDKRDVLLDELSELANFVVSEEENGAVSVFLGGHHLVWQGDAAQIESDATLDPATLTIQWTDNTSTVRATGGKLAGLVAARDEALSGLQADLDAMATGIVTEVNAIHSAGFGLDDTTGLAFFTGTTAGNIAMNTALDHTDKIATAGPDSADPSVSAGPGDGSVALSISQLADADVMDGDTMSIGDYYRNMVGRIGMEALNAKNEVDGAQTLSDHLQQRREEISGVSLDEETVNLVQYQRAYEAASRLVSVIDEMLDRLINSTGLVGR